MTTRTLRITVCELPDDPEAVGERWPDLVNEVLAHCSELVVRPEMPFDASYSSLSSTTTFFAE